MIIESLSGAVGIRSRLPRRMSMISGRAMPIFVFRISIFIFGYVYLFADNCERGLGDSINIFNGTAMFNNGRGNRGCRRMKRL